MTDRTVKRLALFERYLSLWVLLCMCIGMLIGKLLPHPVAFLSNWEFVNNSHINVPIAVLIWLMIYPMMLKIDFGGLKGVAERPKGLLVTLFVNWLVKPFSMAFLGWFFVQFLFSQRLGWIESETAKQYTAGLIILAAAPCTAMVFVWSSGLAYGLMRLFKVRHNIATPGSLIGASNFFELAVAVAIALFGPTSPAALATVVGVLVEVPVMLSVCRMCVSSRDWYEGNMLEVQVGRCSRRAVSES
jgi:ACR3 family arsenite efflux pump ArsB